MKLLNLAGWGRPVGLGLVFAATVLIFSGCATDQVTPLAVADDPAIIMGVKNAFQAYPGHKYDEVQVDCVNGNVRLTGRVDTIWLKYNVWGVVLPVPGVRAVDNHISAREGVDPYEDGTEADKALSQRVSSAFTANADYKFERVKIDAKIGTVELSGYVNTPEQKSQAENLAKQVAGGTNVVNNISVRD